MIYASYVDGNKSFIGMWKCNSNEYIVHDGGATFHGYFTKYNDETNNGLDYPYSLLFYQSNNVKNAFFIYICI